MAGFTVGLFLYLWLDAENRARRWRKIAHEAIDVLKTVGEVLR